MTRSLTWSAAPPFVSQAAFSVVSFLSIAGLARHASSIELATVIAAYSLESMAVSYGNARWIALLVQREPLGIRRGDLEVLRRGFSRLLALGAPLFLAGAYLVQRDAALAVWAALWAAAMAVADLARLVASRFLGVGPVAVLGLTHVAVVAGFTLALPHLEVRSYVAWLTVIGLASALVHWLVVYRASADGRSHVWAADVTYGRALGSEALGASAATGVGGAVLSVVNPAVAVGLQLASQILATPAAAVAQAMSVPLSRRARGPLAQGLYPRRLIARWALFCLGLPVLAMVALVPLRSVVQMLLGPSTTSAYLFLPVVTLQAMMILGWEPMVFTRRWTQSPQSARNHVVVTITAYFVVVCAISAIIADPAYVRDLLVVTVSLFLATTTVRAFLWWQRPGSMRPT